MMPGRAFRLAGFGEPPDVVGGVRVRLAKKFSPVGFLIAQRANIFRSIAS